MTGILIRAYGRDQNDNNGKEQKVIAFVSINGGKLRAVSKADLLKAVTMVLPEVDDIEEVDEPEDADISGLSFEPANGNRHEAAAGR